MGMFDYINVSDSLPFSEEAKELGVDKYFQSYQTKDLDNAMSMYYIKDGKIFVEDFEINEWVEGDPKSSSVMGRVGYIKSEKPYLKEVVINHPVNFYAYVEDVNDKWDCWVEFKANFKDGIVTGYEFVKFEKKENFERKKAEKEFWERIDRERALWYNKYIFDRELWRRFRILWIRAFNKLSLLCLKISKILP